MTKVIKFADSQNYRFKHHAVATVGYFDGVHLGHQLLIKDCVKTAKELRLASIIFTFEETENYLRNGDVSLNITPLADKIKKIKSFKPDYIIIFKMDLNFINISAETFIELLQSRFLVSSIIVGNDFQFGKAKMGNIKQLQKSIPTKALADYKVNQLRISSTIIRKQILAGKVDQLYDLLGSNYRITAIIEHGAKLGRKIGFPTANQSCEIPYVIPQNGVYESIAIIGGKSFKAITNIGFKPTFNGKVRLIETHILNFKRSVYNQKLTVVFLKKIRNEKKFSGIDEIKKQIEKDLKVITSKQS